jgi:hypothetical protein
MGNLPPGRYSVYNATTGLYLAMSGTKVIMAPQLTDFALWDIKDVTGSLVSTVQNVGTKNFLGVENTVVQGDKAISEHWFIEQQAASKTGYFFSLDGSVLYLTAWGPNDVRLELHTGQISQLWVPKLIKAA